MSLLEIGQKPIDNNSAKVKELENKVNTNKSNITTLQGQFNDISQTVRTHTNIIAENQTNLRNSAKKNQANTFTQNQKIQGQLEIRQNGNAIKVGNTIGNAACYMELFNSNERRAFVGHTSTGSNTFEINNGNADIKLVGNQINVDNKKIVNVANPTNNNDAVNKQYVDTKNVEQDREITANRTRNQEQDITIQQQGKRITALEQRPPGSIDWSEIQEITGGGAIRLKASLPQLNTYSLLGILAQDVRITNNYGGTENTLKLGRDGLSLNNQPIIPIVSNEFRIPNREFVVGNNYRIEGTNIPQNVKVIGYSIKNLDNNFIYPSGKTIYSNNAIGIFTLNLNSGNIPILTYWSSNGLSHTLSLSITLFYTPSNLASVVDVNENQITVVENTNHQGEQ